MQGSYATLRKELLSDLPSIAPFFESEQINQDSMIAQSSGVPAEITRENAQKTLLVLIHEV